MKVRSDMLLHEHLLKRISLKILLNAFLKTFDQECT